MAINFPKSVFCGGLISYKSASDSVLQFDGKNWQSLSNMKVARCGAAAVYCEGMCIIRFS